MLAAAIRYVAVVPGSARLCSALIPEPEKRLSVHNTAFFFSVTTLRPPALPAACCKEMNSTILYLLAYSEPEGCAAWRPEKAMMSCRFPFRRVTATCLSCRPRISGCTCTRPCGRIYGHRGRGRRTQSPRLASPRYTRSCLPGACPPAQRCRGED